MGRKELSQLWQHKKDAKEHLFFKYWPKIQNRTPLLVVFSPQNPSQKEILFKVLEGFLVLPLKVVILAEDEVPDGTFSTEQKIAWLNPSISKKAEIEKILLASDMALLFEEHQETLRKLFEKGIVPIALGKSPLLENYHPNQETGNSFTFKEMNAWDMFSAVVRANETYRFPYDWQNIVRGALKVR